jgi:recombination protein RecA
METYDIKCYFPYNNFIAEGIVVHNSGKSTICGHAVAECQKKGGVVLYIDGEHAVDKHYFEALGVDTTKMLIAQPSCGEEGFNIAMDMIETGTIDLIIIDSDSSLIPKKVLDGEVGDSSIGKKALLNSNAYPKLKGALSQHNVCVIVISQYREKIGVMFGNPTTTQGGHALKFYSDVRIEVSKSLAKEGDVTYGNVTKVKAIKNKMSPPYRKSEFEIVYGQGIDKLGELMELINEHEIGRKYGKTMTIDDVKYDLEEFKVMLMDNKEFYDSIKERILNKINQTEKLTEDVTSEI